MEIGYILTIVFAVIWIAFEIISFVHNKRLAKKLDNEKNEQKDHNL